MQIVYISKRPDVLLETMEYVTGLMDFVTEALVVLPKGLELNTGRITVPVHVVTDEDLLGNKLSSYLHDHQLLNFQLRRAAYSSRYVREEFIASDDDYRPLKPIKLEFYKSDGKYHSYFFYDLSLWKFGSGDFDLGQQNTSQILKHLGLPTLSYASHMPQIINRDNFLEMLDFLREHLDYSLCEWSTYFNFCQERKSSFFHKPSPFRTFTWPAHPLAWPPHLLVPEFCFENFTPQLYEKNRPFKGISSTYNEAMQNTTTAEKLIKWHRYEICLANPDIRLTRELRSLMTFREVLMRRILSPLRKLRKRLAWKEYAKLNAIEGRIEQLARQPGANLDT